MASKLQDLINRLRPWRSSGGLFRFLIGLIGYAMISPLACRRRLRRARSSMRITATSCWRSRAGATSFLCFTNTMRIDSDTEVTETRVKPNRPDGRLMSARVPADSSELGRRHSHRHQPSVFGFPRVTEIRPSGERHGI